MDVLTYTYYCELLEPQYLCLFCYLLADGPNLYVSWQRAWYFVSSSIPHGSGYINSLTASLTLPSILQRKMSHPARQLYLSIANSGNRKLLYVHLRSQFNFCALSFRSVNEVLNSHCAVTLGTLWSVVGAADCDPAAFSGCCLACDERKRSCGECRYKRWCRIPYRTMS